MKLALAVVAAAMIFAGCATQDATTADELGAQLERGVTGQGTLYERDFERDPFVDSSHR